MNKKRRTRTYIHIITKKDYFLVKTFLRNFLSAQTIKKKYENFTTKRGTKKHTCSEQMLKKIWESRSSSMKDGKYQKKKQKDTCSEQLFKKIIERRTSSV